MNQLPSWTKGVLLALLPAVMLIAILHQRSSLTVMASNQQQNIADEHTDIISVVLKEATLKGLIGKPDELNLFQAKTNEVTLPGDEFFNHHTVWLAWIKGIIVPNWPGASNRPTPANHLYIFVDADTGQVFQLLASEFPIEEFNQKSWVTVTESDIGQFPIPKFVPDRNLENVSPVPTEAPANQN